MVFLSHKSDPDHELAASLARLLESHDVSTWIAPESVGPGKDFVEEIIKAINACEIFLLILTKDSQTSKEVYKELLFAANHRKQIIPIMIGEFEVSEVFEYRLLDVQIRPFDMSEPSLEWLVERCKMGEHVVNMEIGRNPFRSVSIVCGDYEKNMDEYIREHPDRLPSTVFAMGIDCSSSLAISSTKGILKWVCQYLRDEHGMGLDDLQELVDQAMIAQLGIEDVDHGLAFKQSVLITVPLAVTGLDGEPLGLQLLLIANSKKGQLYGQSHDVDDVEGIDSREIVLEVFSACARLGERAHTLFIGAMGTNGLQFPYEVVTAEILNCFAYAQRLGIEPLDLYYSVRKQDMEAAGLTVDNILSYVATIVSFFKERYF